PESYSSVKFQSPIIHSKTPVSLQTLSHSPSFVLSSLVAPLCGIKPLQFTTTKFSTQPYVSTSTSRFRSKTPFQFDLPVVQPNITSLRPNVSDHLAYNNNNNNTIPNNNTTNINNGNANRNIDNAAGNVQNLNNGKRKRSWSRAVFSNLQRKGLEIQFQQQKYITKPDRRKLAARLNLTDAQVKVWFQNRRMKWRHTRENLKSGQEKQPISTTTPSASHQAPHVRSDDHDLPGYSTDGSSSVEMSENENESDEIDVVE
uniref:Homeobox domain-containing protein n=1 Tax=Glossina pallidipes TaxID=7398 RepID=A0A1B0A5L2_GLOPL